MKNRALFDWLAAPLLLLLLAVFQLSFFVRHDWREPGEEWFLFGTDTVAHDAIVHLWVQQWWEREPGTIPLWMPELHGGLPTLGAFLWTPFAPPAWPLLIAEYPIAQRMGWTLALFIAGCGGFVLGRALRLRGEFALLVGAGWMLAGHLVTLIHAGHFQKVMALSWLGWAAAGAVMAADPSSSSRRAEGIAIGGLGVGMTLLCGHPQVTYMALGLTGLWTLWQIGLRSKVRRCFVRHIVVWIVMAGAGLALGGAQLLPGLEMSSMSNRAGGVGIEEAVETSYPPGELLELFIPRVKGSSVRGDTYTGEWGERIVSDYAGKLILLLAVCAFLLRRERWVHAWFWFVTAGLSLLVGVGRYTPVYELLYNYLPGFSSFRSPGTFMAVAAISFPVLAGFGAEGLHYRLRRLAPLPHPRFRTMAMGAALTICALAAVDLMRANRHFLIAESWPSFSGYLSPSMEELALMEDGRIVSYFDARRPLALRPILFGASTPLGYHPITFPQPSELEPDPGLPIEAQIPNMVILRDGRAVETNSYALAAFAAWQPSDGEAAGLSDWVERSPNRRVLAVPGEGTLIVRERFLSGWEVSCDEVLLEVTPSEPGFPLLHRVEVPEECRSVTWTYQPPAWRIGLYSTSAAAALLTLFVGFSIRRRQLH